MLFLDWTLETTQQNLALDEVLLEECDAGGPEVLRIWRPRERSVVVGYTQHVEAEVDAESCRAHGVPILRRITGGGTVLHDEGSLCYSLILNSSRPEIGNVSAANCWIMKRQRDVVAMTLNGEKGDNIEVRGHSDLTLYRRKFSGNAQRRKLKAVLFHGTFLLNADFDAMERFLRFPSKQPDYRENRPHRDFLTTLPVNERQLVLSLRALWEANDDDSRDSTVMARVDELVVNKYGRDDWNFRM